MLTTFHALRNLEVLDAQGVSLGKVVDVELESEGWQVHALVIRLERAAAQRLGMHRLLGSTDLALKVTHVKAVGRAVLLREGLDELRSVAPPAQAEAEQVRP